jgi:hypothetical protein
MVEINVGIICACLPTMRPLLMKSFPRIFSNIDSASPQHTPRSDDSYPLKGSGRKPRRPWDYISGVDTLWTAHDPEQPSASDSTQAIVPPTNAGQEPSIAKSTNITVSYNEPKK